MKTYCAGCGAGLVSGARYCSACGSGVTEPNPIYTAPRPLIRPRVGRKVAGVCQGLADQNGADVTLIRVITVLLSVLVFPVGLIAYGACWLVIPEEPIASAAMMDLKTTV